MRRCNIASGHVIELWGIRAREVRAWYSPALARSRLPTPIGDLRSTAPKRVRARHRGAHLKGPRRAKPRGRPQAPDACASLRQSPAPPQIIPLRGTRRGLTADPRRCAATRSSAQQKASTDDMHAPAGL